MLYKYYIQTREDGCITWGWSDGPYPDRDTTGAICIGERLGYHFRLTPDGAENPELLTIDGIPLYRWTGLMIIGRNEDDIKQERALQPAPPPSDMEKLRADVDYIAIIQGVDLI